MSAGLAPGFTEPVPDAQRSFRRMLDAMARPGSVHSLAAAPAVGRLSPATTAIALTLLDFETPLWLAPELAGAADYLRFHCGCPLVERTDQAEFAVLDAAAVNAGCKLERFRLGSDEYPDRSTTLIVQVEALNNEADRPGLRLRGPGIEDAATLTVAGINTPFWLTLQASRDWFPRGVDLLLTDRGGRVAALPRTTRLEVL